MTHLFTLICEYQGGTYTSQLHAPDPDQAFALWAEQFAQAEVLTPAERHLFVQEAKHALDEASLVAMDGLQNVWYEGFSLGDALLEVIIVGMSNRPIQAADAEPLRMSAVH